MARAALRPAAAVLGLLASLPMATTAWGATPRTPIEHVIVLVGENRTFDNLFATYTPRRGQSIHNLLSQGIVKADGTPGRNFPLARQRLAEAGSRYSPTPRITGEYPMLPQPYAPGAFGQRRDVPDARFPRDLPNGPFQITRHVSYGAHTGDPVHRFFQMWQQVDGGANDLFVWTAETVGPGRSNPPNPLPITPANTFQGGVAMGFYNMAQGDAPLFKALADRYAIADNYHQPVMGGTTANYFALATADVGVHLVDGKPGLPPARLVENPDPQPGTNNFFTEDGYAGGTYVACADRTAPGVAPIRDHLAKLPYKAFRDGNCDAGQFYMVNNLEPWFNPDGSQDASTTKIHLPPQTMPHIGDALTAAGVSWKWYSGGRNDGKRTDKEYCGMCDTPTFFAGTMQGPDIAKLQDLQQLYVDLQGKASDFPAVSFVAPYDSLSGHPGYAMAPAFDDMVKGLLDRLQANPELWARTAVLVTFDEGGGYYDSGYVQAIDFFGDGTRIPLLVLSPYAKAGHVDHTYYDHASILKFIQHNWGLKPLSHRSRDNLPNPVHTKADPYVPVNRPAIGDLTGLFDFGRIDVSRAAGPVAARGR